jgi:two-component SAPR family response regulator
MNIAVIDDEKASLNTFLSHICDDGEIKCSFYRDNPENILDDLDDNGTEVAFLDINMPRVNGVDLAEKIIKRKHDVKIVFITGYERDEKAIAKRLGENLLGFCNKPYDDATLKRFIDAAKQTSGSRGIFFRTFPTFDLVVDGKTVVFSRTKSKELLALLVDRNGSTVDINETIACLWGDRTPELAKRLYRDAICRLRLMLAENDLTGLVKFGRGWTALNCEGTTCDVWEYVKNEDSDSFGGRYMASYEWASEKAYALQLLMEKRAKR